MIKIAKTATTQIQQSKIANGNKANTAAQKADIAKFTITKP